jgi:hypothetical protein
MFNTGVNIQSENHNAGSGAMHRKQGFDWNPCGFPDGAEQYSKRVH